MIINHLNIYPPKITGRGTDEVGDYTISGELKPDNTATFVKQYTGKHCVNYEGTYDTIKICGKWNIPSLNQSDTFEISKDYAWWKGWD